MESVVVTTNGERSGKGQEPKEKIRPKADFWKM